ncbi:hypothetical protein ISF_03185 [Cordyceps fumosorosea ARSEF 2679]|uniref:Uncharacterized protein n=1 Tax=Cordyceps fumosorosea (strain ARSEF 2679) TaxID=1081104 RepID=A0A168AIX2_CORFA|nr:hypothetical protein ISF_03185 [Cordyceps fumosorosea ARSEF 2679]OAA68810.1 hypothetical protein ISF_03185 [Cordyceps fumosorosea ARSEF 2679]
MAAPTTPRRSDVDKKPHSYRHPSPSPDSSGDDLGTDSATSEGPSPASLPGRRDTRAPRFPPSGVKPPPLKTDNESLRALVRKRNSAGNEAQSPASEGELPLTLPQLREILWASGRRYLGSRELDHINVAAVSFPRSWTAAVPSCDGNMLIRIMVHPKGGSKPFTMTRKFERSVLSEMVPEPLQSPSTPNFDRKKLLSAVAGMKKTQASSRPRRGVKAAAAAAATQRKSIPDGVPMNFYYALCRVPVLAAIILSGKVSFGDTIVVPMPYPEAWAETVAWVYTGEEKLLADKVAQNARFLGGQVTKDEERKKEA